LKVSPPSIIFPRYQLLIYLSFNITLQTAERVIKTHHLQFYKKYLMKADTNLFLYFSANFNQLLNGGHLLSISSINFIFINASLTASGSSQKRALNRSKSEVYFRV
jgi:hypothetical protein